MNYLLIDQNLNNSSNVIQDFPPCTLQTPMNVIVRIWNSISKGVIYKMDSNPSSRFGGWDAPSIDNVLISQNRNF